jgi:two-component system sensor kinase FixL
MDPGPLGLTVEPDRILAAVFDASEDAIIVTGPDGRVLAWNRGAERIYGYGARDMIGQPLDRLFPEERRDEAGALLGRIAAGECVDPHETVHVARGRHRVDVVLTITSIRRADGTIAGAAAMARDVTAERRAERGQRSSEARARAIIDSAVDGIILIDHRGQVESFNPAAERLFQYRAGEVIGRNVSMLMPEPYASEHDHYLRRHQTTGERRIIGIGREVTGRRRDGSTFPIHLSVAELTIEGETKFTGIVRDLTDRVKLEVKLREESGLVRLGELAAVLAHEVKNPLAAVSGAIQVLAERLTADDDREIAAEVLRRLDGLAALMGDLLLYSRPPKPRFAPVRIVDLVGSLLAFMRLDQAWRDVEVRVEGQPAETLADGELLKVALQNLFVNAVQAMNGRGQLEVRIDTIEGNVHIDVADSGPGIPQDVQARLFTPFFTTKARGTGLGLATVRRIAEAHEGTVGIRVSGPKGTTVRLSLPAMQVEASSWTDS